MIPKSKAIPLLNRLGSCATPFKFYCDFLGNNWVITNKEDNGWILEINNRKLPLSGKRSRVGTSNTNGFLKYPTHFKQFKSAFDQVVREINYGNSFLTNLTFKTPIDTDLSLKDIFQSVEAKYKVLTDDFIVFSPETFIKIIDGKIFSFPMKGTINADLPSAKNTLLNDPKEIAEHVTIVDLIRNDLSLVASNVQVNKFRYIDQIITNEKNLLQVSSEISGELSAKWQENLGSILTTLLPAGSISGAPKGQTIEIIRAAENYERGFYTGICGQFDGSNLDTGVMIRFIQKEEEKYYYFSGGGITSFSDVEKEYQEMIDKIYLPFI